VVDEQHVMWSKPERERTGRPHLVLLHGYGSHEGDLFQLAPYLPEQLVFAAVRAPLAHPMGVGFSWYPLDGEADGTGIDAAADELAEFLEGVRGRASWLGTLGFSQGGVIGLQVLRRHPGLVDAHVMLASARHPERLPELDAELELRRPPVFWGRGTADAVFPAWRFADTADWLPDHSRLTERIYEGLGHAVSEPMLDDVSTFLRANLPKPDWTIELATSPELRVPVDPAIVDRLRALLRVVQENGGDAPREIVAVEEIIRGLLDDGYSVDAIADDAALSREPVQRVAEGLPLFDA
jgi:phospholipase/carboxylesterase